MGNLSDSLKEANKNYGDGSEWLTLEQGENGPFRLLVTPSVYAEHFAKNGYKGICIGKENYCIGCEEGTKPTPKWLSWASSGKEIALAKFGYAIIKQLSSFQDSSEYAFSEYPMPWTFTIKKTGEGLDTEYSVVPSRQNSTISTDTMDSLKKKKTVEQIIEAMKEKKGKKEVSPAKPKYPQPGEDGIPNPEDVPF